MNLTDAIWNSLSNRELALLFWFGSVLTAVFIWNKGRSSIRELLKILLSGIVIKVLAFMILYLFCMVNLIHWLVDLGPQHVKDVLFWMFSVGLVMLFNLSKYKSLEEFKLLIFDAVRFTILIEFIVSFHSFSLITELMLMPFITILALMQVATETKESTRYFAKGVQNVINYILVAIFVFALYKTIVNYEEVLSFTNLISLLLPSTLTILFLPYVYILTLYMAYEDYFIHLDFMTKEMAKVKLLKRAIMRHANLNLDKLARVRQHFSKRAIYDGTDLNNYIKELCNSRTTQ
ncbi:MAG: hypothetical protein Q8J69_10820 [Sphingobacteriaceae bacterium]|nr:hypothetical protein [Sphingobacteriaceae bacterium]